MTKFGSEPQRGHPDKVPEVASIRWVTVVGALIMLAIIAAATWAIGSYRERALRDGERELSNTALLLARHFDREFEDFLADEGEIVAHVDWVSADSLATLSTHQLLKSKSGGVGHIDVFNAAGALIASSRSWPAPDYNIADGVDLQTLKASPSSEERTMQLVQDPFHGPASLVMLRRLAGPEGELRGVITRSIPTDWYVRFFASVSLGDTAAISMFRSDGLFVTRYPETAAAVGRNYKGGILERHFAEPAVTLRVASPFDGEERLASSRQLAHAPITLIASRSIRSVLADWREQTAMLVAAALAAVGVIAGVLFALGRELREQQEATRRRLKLEKHRLDVAINNMSQGLTLFDADGRLVVCNRRYLEIYHLSDKVVKPGATYHDIMQHFREVGANPHEVEKFVCFADEHQGVGGTHEVTLPNGAVLVTRVPVQGGGWVTTHEDITERKRAHARIAYLAHYDELTDLPNRAAFRQHLTAALAEVRDGGQVALFYIDIDEFKGVNDTLGHVVGDRLLSMIGAKLKDAVGETGFVARLGGDEFALVMSDVKTVDEVTAVAELIQCVLRDFHDCGEHSLPADASMGIAIAPEHATEIGELVSKADLALYAAKAEGRRTYRFYRPEMDSTAKARHVLGADLKRAVAERQFEVHYQPLVDLGDDRVVGCEALLRWRHPTRGMVSPAEFIPIAEEIGLIEELGEWVLAEACREAASWPDHMTLAVNVSPLQFKRQTFPLKVTAALGRSGLPPHRLELEITEALLIRDDEATLAILTELRDLGVRIALDDFGTGYSSLSYLHRFPIDKIKIDRSFVDTLAEAGQSSTIVQAIVAIAASGNKVTLAEGVETVEQRELLKRFGCHQMQGWLFSPALPAGKLRTILGLDDDERAASRQAG